MRRLFAAVLMAMAALVTLVASAGAVTQTIPNAGTQNLRIDIADDGRVQATVPGVTPGGMFYPPSSDNASNYFYVRVKSGTHADTTFSNRNSSEVTPVSNGPVTGNFTPQSPAQNITVYDLGPSGGPAVVRVTQTTLYVALQKRFNIIWEVRNISGAPLQFIAGTAADLYINGSDSGIGVFIDGPNRFVGGTNATSRKVGGLREVTLSRKPGEPSDTAIPRWASYEEGGYSSVTGRLIGSDAFLNSIVDSQVDNGVGASWDDRSTPGAALAVAGTARYEVQWVAEQTVPLTASPAQTSKEAPGQHQVILQLSDADGNAVPGLPLRWRIDGTHAFPAAPAEYVRAVTNAEGQVVVTINGTTPGEDTVLAFADVLGAENGVREAAEPQASARVTWLADNRVAGAPTVPGSLTGPSGSVPVGTIANPENSEAPVYTFGNSATAAAGFPTCDFNGRSGRELNFPIQVTLEPGAGTIDAATLLVVNPGSQDPEATSGPTEPASITPDGNTGATYTFTVNCVTNADLWLRFTITEGGDTQTFVIPIGGLLLIDPQGVVYDRINYDAAIAQGQSPEQARATAAISGATVRLQRRNPAGTFVNVLSGDPGITPNINPQITGANGLYQWDVAAGVYRVTIDAPGYFSQVSREVTIPPPVLDLHIAMERTNPPAPPAGNETPTPTPVTPAVTKRVRPFALTGLPKRAKVVRKLSRKNVVSLGRVACPKLALRCPGLKVVLRPVARGKGKLKLPATLATRSLLVRPGKRAALAVTLTPKIAKQVRARKSLRVRATVTGKSLKPRVIVFTLKA